MDGQISRMFREMFFDRGLIIAPDNASTFTDETDSECEEFFEVEPCTENGAACLRETGVANLNFFGTSFVFFNGRRHVSDTEAEKVLTTLHELLDAAYEEDANLAIRNVLYLGNLRDGGVKNHSAYMVSLVHLYDKHPKTFITYVAPLIAENSCARDILTLLSVITPNRTFPLERLWKGEQPDACSSEGRTSIKGQELLIWKALLKEFGAKSSKDVVTSELSSKKVRFSDMKSCSETEDGSIPGSDGSLSPPIHECDVVNTGRVEKRGRVKEPTRNRNTWINIEFKDRWHEERTKLHARDYGSISGFAGTDEDYKAFVDFVVEWFATRLATDDPFAGKWAPTANASYDKATKGSLAFILPASAISRFRWHLASDSHQDLRFRHQEGSRCQRAEEIRDVFIPQEALQPPREVGSRAPAGPEGDIYEHPRLEATPTNTGRWLKPRSGHGRLRFFSGRTCNPRLRLHSRRRT